MKKLLLFILIICANQQVYAEPVIESASGVAIDGQSFSFTGTGFGTKSTAAPLMWDKFDQPQHNVGDKIDETGDWVAGDSIVGTYHNPKYNATNTRTGSDKHILVQWPNAGTSSGVDSHCPFLYDADASIETLYLSFWVRIDYDGYYYDVDCGSLCGNMKWLWITKDFSGSLYTDFAPSLYTSTTIPTQNVNAVVSNKSGLRDGTNTGIPLSTDYHDWPMQSSGWDGYSPNTPVWVRVEYIMVETSSIEGVSTGNSDGYIVINYQQNGEGYIFQEMYDPSPNYNNEAMPTNVVGNTNHWGTVRFGEYNRDELIDIEFSFDDIYIDNSLVRVEIGDNEVYGDCTHREIQPLTAHSNTGGTFTVNQSSFDDGGAYLFAIDNDNVASAGYPITLGATSTSTASLPGATLQGASME